MSFKFGLLKGLSLVNLIVSGFFGICLALMVVFTMQMAMLIGLFLVGAAVIHSWLSLSLHRSLAYPQLQMKDNAPDGLRIIGAIAAVYAFMLLSAGWSVLSNPDMYAQEVMKMNPDIKYALPDIGKLYTVSGIFMLVYGASLMVNYLLSLNFLQVWKYRQQQNSDQGM
ncbi:hypothetical protein GA0116948_10617 [Chitinophaga costaii]|uniref:Uncharacterized protein n=1 Tax=Chitinophaga costaii TaxID=1335309 RepID=A0A1C4DNC3_9BACT|nr:hypothetical protein [Chitinophaga costaii]PUZ27712.1 hypothetical protein DCM91_05730 [Chitinophaga costaii]SCC32889.1 hypothetical protein GA0116948_10617 [Chitinophaga costaii]